MCGEVDVWSLQQQKIRIVCQCWFWTLNIIVNISHLKMLCKISNCNTTSMWLGHKYAGVKKRILCLTNTMNHVFEEEKTQRWMCVKKTPASMWLLWSMWKEACIHWNRVKYIQFMFFYIPLYWLVAGGWWLVIGWCKGGM